MNKDDSLMMVVFVYHLYVSINYNTNINSAFCPEFTYFIEEFLWRKLGIKQWICHLTKSQSKRGVVFEQTFTKMFFLNIVLMMYLDRHERLFNTEIGF